MSNIITYCRVSTEEQKTHGFSLASQKERLFNYAKQNKYNVVMHYEEDYSAKNFNRPEWKKLRTYCSKYYQMIDKVIFTKWDRFSRNAKEAHKEIDWFKEKGIEIYSVDNPLDFSVPENKIPLALYLTLSELENDRISIHVKDGLRKATKEGCWTAIAPYGYTNYRNSANKATLIPDENASYVLDTFLLLASKKIGVRQAWLEMRNKGMIISSSQFHKLIKNPVYIGKVTLKSNTEDASVEIREGLHAPIVPTVLFKKVQKRLISEAKEYNLIGVKNPLYPLKGFIKCSRCDKVLTASASTGRNPNRKYYYYHCRNGCKERFPVNKAHELFYEYLKKISIDTLRFNTIKKEIKREVQKEERLLGKRIQKIKKQITYLTNTIIKAEDRFFEGVIDPETFKNAKVRYLAKIKVCKGKISELKGFNPVFEFQNRIQKLKRFIDLPKKYKKADFATRVEILESVLNGKKIALHNY